MPVAVRYLLLWLTLAAGLLAVRAGLALAVPIGSDAALWGLAAMEVRRGLIPSVAPGYPILVALTPGPTWWSGGVVSALSAAGVSTGLLWLLLRHAVQRWVAIGLAAAPLLMPALLLMSIQLQPDALTQLLLLVVIGTGLAWDARPDRRRAVCWLLAGIALALTREHGVIVLPAMLLALMLRAGLPVWVPLLGAVLGGLGLWLGADVLPDRLRVPLQSSPLGAGKHPLPEYMTHFRNHRGAPLREAWMAGEGLRFWSLIVGELLRRSAENLAVVLLGAIGFLWSRQRSGLVALAPAATLLFFWSHERHSAVLIPAALVGIGLLLRELRRPVLLALPLGIVLLAPLREAPQIWERLQGAVRHAREQHDLARWMAEQPGEWMLGGLDNELNLYLGWPRHVPILAQRCAQVTWDAAGWRTLWVAPVGLMPPPMVPLQQHGHLALWRLEPPEDTPRPCQDSPLPRGPLYATGSEAVQLEGGCSGDVDAASLRGWTICPQRPQPGGAPAAAGR
ncbi:MAG: hypothetical protein P8R54_04930 [Myxococcota bacterium]|nr:hypothetical protein [Myxococcota bacterium]